MATPPWTRLRSEAKQGQAGWVLGWETNWFASPLARLLPLWRCAPSLLCITISPMPERVSRIEDPWYIFGKRMKELQKHFQVFTPALFPSLYNLFTFPYSFFSFIHLLITLALAWASFYIEDINTVKGQNFREKKIPKTKEIYMNLVLVAV